MLPVQDWPIYFSQRKHVWNSSKDNFFLLINWVFHFSCFGVELAVTVENHFQQLKFSYQMASLDLQWTVTTDPYFVSHALKAWVLCQIGKQLELILNFWLNHVLYKEQNLRKLELSSWRSCVLLVQMAIKLLLFLYKPYILLCDFSIQNVVQGLINKCFTFGPPGPSIKKTFLPNTIRIIDSMQNIFNNFKLFSLQKPIDNISSYSSLTGI